MDVVTRAEELVASFRARRRRKRLERQLNALVRGTRDRRRLVIGAGLVAGVAVAGGALVARRMADDAQPA